MSVPTLLLIDPSPQPPNWLSSIIGMTGTIQHAQDMAAATQFLRAHSCQAVLVSIHFHTQKLLPCMELVKSASQQELIPWIWVMDTQKRLAQFPLSPWADRLGFVYPQLSQAEWLLLLERLLKSDSE